MSEAEERAQAEKFVVEFWKENGHTVLQYSSLVDMCLQFAAAQAASPVADTNGAKALASIPVAIPCSCGREACNYDNYWARKNAAAPVAEQPAPAKIMFCQACGFAPNSIYHTEHNMTSYHAFVPKLAVAPSVAEDSSRKYPIDRPCSDEDYQPAEDSASQPVLTVLDHKYISEVCHQKGCQYLVLTQPLAEDWIRKAAEEGDRWIIDERERYGIYWAETAIGTIGCFSLNWLCCLPVPSITHAERRDNDDRRI